MTGEPVMPVLIHCEARRPGTCHSILICNRGQARKPARPSQTCSICGFHANADYNAAVNNQPRHARACSTRETGTAARRGVFSWKTPTTHEHGMPAVQSGV